MLGQREQQVVADDEHAELLTLQGFCQLTKGAVGDAERCASALCELGLAADWSYAYHFGALLAGRCALAAARPSRAAVWLGEAAARPSRAAVWLGEAAVPTSGPASAIIRRYTLTRLALAHSLAGRHADSQGVLREAERDPDSRPPYALAELAAFGRTTKQIATQLNLSQRTVENHLQHSYRKLSIGRREDLATVLGAGGG